MKTLEYLIPYLPYNLEFKILNYKNDYVGEKYGICNGFYYLGDTPHYSFKDRGTAGKDISLIKPILKPVESITEEIGKGMGLDSIDVGAIQFMLESSRLSHNSDQLLSEFLQYRHIIILLKNHYDIFKLIEKGWAINKNQ